MCVRVTSSVQTGVSVKTIMRLGALLPQEPISTETVAREHLMPLTRKYAAKLVDLVSQQVRSRVLIHVCVCVWVFLGVRTCM